MNILTLNAGSSSIKYKAYQVNNEQLSPLVSGLIEGIGESSGEWHHTKETKSSENHHFKTHEQAFAALAHKLYQDLADHPIQGVGHRVVHGGKQYFEPTIITSEVLTEIRALAKLAPIHNPVNAEGIEFAMQYYPEAVHVAIFDSGFHHTMPSYVRQYAINSDIATRYQIQRYGFHGINHEYVAQQAAFFLNKPLSSCHFITLHLGNGASACLIKNGQSIDTSMGMTPLAGLIMGTRCGDIDPAIVLYLQHQGMSRAEVDTLLNKRSGLKGIADENDMRKLVSRALARDESAKLAIDMYVYAIQKMIGAYYSQLSKLDALIFTGGVGENASLIREKIITPLQHLGLELDVELNTTNTPESCRKISKSHSPILVIRGDEEALIAQKVALLCS
ncbi:acetate/propionate family kinase [Legionella maceachernii]|uniref:Acetate kinase n=1 Tax=Legionella maceachernii TaxID=466 RepID=A0A0W0W9X3_9GAMM|nr:acetate/propionate family kinase [Legionella maceachernii]KTD28790.1 Acetate kinase (Acetokinase) [Legionella maceachernii]SJZ71096.1 acetate kinase [Legionella maceachernii]SUP02331.1 Acetate kinase [Legionella maceachernii]